MNDSDYSEFDMSESTPRDFDIVVYGATGFTGALVAEYLHENQSELSWAIAGRSQTKLDDLKKTLNAPDLATLVADSSSTDDMRRLAASSRVIVSTVGPYARFGTPLVEACAAEGTHYCDLTGEPQWMASIFEKVSAMAEETGARLVHCCGFDSIPSDLGVLALQRALLDATGEPADHVVYALKTAKGGASGGTIASMLNVLEEARDPAVRRILGHPYALNPENDWRGPDGSDLMRARFDRDLG